MTIIAVIGVVIGAAALLIVLSGFAGLKEYSLQFSSIIDPDLKVVPAKGKTIPFNSNIKGKVNQIAEIASYSKIIEERAVLVADTKRQIITIKGVDKHYPQSTIQGILSLGSWPIQGSNYIVSGWGVASNLSFGVMDYGKVLKLYTPKPGKGQISSEKHAFNIMTTANIGIFEINEQLDHELVYANLEMVRTLLNYSENDITALEIKLTNKVATDKVRDKLQALFGAGTIIKTKEQLNDSLHKMLNTENLAVYLIFTLVLIIALFNVVGSLIMMILDKKKDLKTLFNLGITPQEIRKIFFLQGSLMSVIGGAIGIILAVILISFQKAFGLIMITDSLSYPVALKISDVILVFVTITVLGIATSRVAATRISKSLLR